MNFIFGTADIIIKTLVVMVVGVIFLVLLYGAFWKWNLYTQKMYEDFAVVEYAQKLNREDVGSLVTDVIQPNHKCKNTVDTKIYTPHVPEGLIVDEVVYVYDDGHTKQWHKAIVKAINKNTKTISVLYFDSSIYELPATNIPYSRVRRLPSSSEIESCANGCGMNGSISVGECEIDAPCKCACTSEYDECREEPNTLWNTYMVDPNTVNIKKRAIQFGILKKDKETSGSSDDTNFSNSNTCEANSECVSYCDKLTTANERALCKNPSRLMEYSSYIPQVATLKTDAMCNYQLPTSLRTALKCPSTTVKKACWQYFTQTECDANSTDDCKWNLVSNTCQTNRTTQQKCSPFTTARVFHKKKPSNYFNPIFKDSDPPDDSEIIEQGFYPIDITDKK